MATSSVCSDVELSSVASPLSILPSVRVVIPVSDSTQELPMVTPNDSSSSMPDEAGRAGEKIGRWTESEHLVFLEGLEKHGKQWKTIAGMIGTRTVVQVRTHAQKYFQKMERKNNASGVVSSGSSTDSSTVKPHPEPRFVQPKRKSLPGVLPSSASKKKVKKTPRLSLSLGPGASSTYSPDEVSAAPGATSVPELLQFPNPTLSKSSSLGSGNWSTVSPNNVIGELIDFPVDKYHAMAQHVQVLDDELQDSQMDDDDSSFDLQELGQDPLEWLIDIDTQHYLPESSLPAFPELGDAAVQEMVTTAVANEMVENAVLNNMVDPSVTLQSLFLHNEQLFAE